MDAQGNILRFSILNALTRQRARSAGTLNTSHTAGLLPTHDPHQVSPRDRDIDSQEAVVERSPKCRFARFNKLLGKGAYKTVTQPFSTPRLRVQLDRFGIVTCGSGGQRMTGDFAAALLMLQPATPLIFSRRLLMSTSLT